MKFLSDHDDLLSKVLRPETDPDDTDYNPDDARENEFERLIPAALNVGHFEEDVENWTTWHLECDFFVCKVPDTTSTYLLCEFAWNDNWGRWEWRSCDALSGARSSRQAADHLLRHYAEEHLEPSSDSGWNNYLRAILKSKRGKK